MDTCFAYGQNPSMLRERYLEAHDLVMRAWQEQDTFAFNGRFNQQRYVNIWPRPMQKPHPPVWIPGGGSVETWQWCAEMDYVYAYLSYFGYKDGQATMQGFWDEMARLGKDLNPYRAGFLQFVGVAESREQAMELYREPAEYFYGRCLRVDPRWAMPPGYVTEATQRAGIQSARSAAPPASTPARQARATTQMEDIVERGYVIIGSPDEVVEQLTEVATEPQCRPPDAAAAVRQHGQGSGQVQHQAVRRAGAAAASALLLRMGGQMVAGADGGAERAELPAPLTRRTQRNDKKRAQRPRSERGGKNEARFRKHARRRCPIAAAPLIQPAARAADLFTLTSSAYQDNAILDVKNAGNAKEVPSCVAEGQNVSPPLAWANAPDTTKSFALTIVDPEGSGGAGFIHLVAYGIPASVTGFAEGELSKPSDKFVGGKNLWNRPPISDQARRRTPTSTTTPTR